MINPNGDRLWILNGGPPSGGSVTVVDVPTNAVLTSIPIPPGPTNGDISPDGSRLYVALGGGNYGISVIDAIHNALITTISTLNGQTWSVAVSEDGRRVYGGLITWPANTVVVMDTQSNTLVSTIGINGTYPSAVVAPRRRPQPRPFVSLSRSSVSFECSRKARRARRRQSC